MDYQAPAIAKRDLVIGLMFNPNACNEGDAGLNNPHCTDPPGGGGLSGTEGD